MWALTEGSGSVNFARFLTVASMGWRMRNLALGAAAKHATDGGRLVRETGQERCFEQFPQCGHSRQNALQFVLTVIASVISLRMRTENVGTPMMNQSVTAPRHVLRISIVRTGRSGE